MIDNDTLRNKLKKELKILNLTEQDEELMVKELNYLSNLLIDIYLIKTKGENNA